MTPKGYEHHIVRTLRREAGYSSALIGLQHIAKDPHIIGYDYIESPVQSCPHVNAVTAVAPRAVRFIRSRPKEPFWLTVGFFETHRPYYQSTLGDKARYIEPPMPILDVPPSRQDMANFHETVRTLDWGVGEVLVALEEAGLAENTLVISTTDHGIAWPSMKCNLSDGGIGVHLVMRGPGGFIGGKVCDTLISQLDMFPSLCELLKIEPPEWLQGRSFLPVLRGETQEINEAIFAEVNYHASYEPKRALRTKRWKYIRHFGDYMHPVLPNCDDSPTKAYWVEHGWAEKTVPREALYDLIFDPNERNNLASDPSHKPNLAEMRHRLDVWMRLTKDPLLHGSVKAPRGARINPPDEISPLDLKETMT